MKQSEHSRESNETNQDKIIRLQEILRTLLMQVLLRGYYGNASMTFVVQDGIIQGIRTTLEKQEK